MIKSFATLIILTFILNVCHAQHYQHFTSWNRILIQKEINDHWQITADYHWRRQSDFAGSSFNPFSLKLMEGFRITTVYRVKEMSFSFTPFLTKSSPLYSKDSDLTRPDRIEIRPSFYAEWSKDLSEKFTFRTRGGYEYRIFKRNDGTWGDQ